jgi:hypothetical protein
VWVLPSIFFCLKNCSTRIGIDSSVIIHVLLRRHMAQILSPGGPNWEGFRADLKTTLTRIGKWGHPTAPARLWLVFDGKRIPTKLSNDDRQIARDHALSDLRAGDTHFIHCHSVLRPLATDTQCSQATRTFAPT